MSPLAQCLKKFLLEQQSLGAFTHYYFSCGKLSGPQIDLESQDNFSENIFDLASLTKALVTTPLVLKEITREGLYEEATLLDWLGTKASCFHKKIQRLKVLGLLSHSSGLPAWRNLWVNRCLSDGSFKSSDHSYLIEKLNYYVGCCEFAKGVLYSDLGFMLLGLCLEIKYQKPLNFLFEDYCTQVLSLPPRVLSYSKELCLLDSVVPAGHCALRKRRLKGEVHDENCASLNGVSGHAGLFGGGAGVLAFLRSFWKTQEAHKILSLAKQQNQMNGEVLSYGWRWGGSKPSSAFGGGKALGHLGFTGCAFWVLPQTSSYVVFLTNRVYKSRLSPEFSWCREKIFSIAHKLLHENK